MSIGRPDYQGGVVPIKSGYSPSQTPYFDSDGIAKLYQTTANLCPYTVATGYQLIITGFSISCNQPGIQDVWFLIDEVVTLYKYFDTVLFYHFPEGSHFIIAAGSTIQINAFNNSPETCWFYAEVLGYLEQIIS